MTPGKTCLWPIKKPQTNVSTTFFRFCSYVTILKVRSVPHQIVKVVKGRENFPYQASSSDFVVYVGWALWGHFLDYINWMTVVPAHLLIVRTVVVFCSP